MFDETRPGRQEPRREVQTKQEPTTITKLAVLLAFVELLMNETREIVQLTSKSNKSPPIDFPKTGQGIWFAKVKLHGIHHGVWQVCSPNRIYHLNGSI